MHGGTWESGQQYILYGTGTTSDDDEHGFESFDQSLNVFDIQLSDFDANIGGYLKSINRPAGRKCELSFSTELVHPIQTPTDWLSLLLIACDFRWGIERNFPGGSISGSSYYLNAHSSDTPNVVPPMVLMLYVQNIKVTLDNCIGAFEIVAGAGGMPRINWRFIGQVTTDTTELEDNQTPPDVVAVKGYPLQTTPNNNGFLYTEDDGFIDPADFVLKSFNININNKLRHRNDSNSTYGFNKPHIVGRDLIYNVKIEVKDLSDFNFHQLHIDEKQIGFGIQYPFDNNTFMVFYGYITQKPLFIDDSNIFYWDLTLKGHNNKASTNHVRIVPFKFLHVTGGSPR